MATGRPLSASERCTSCDSSAFAAAISARKRSFSASGAGGWLMDSTGSALEHGRVWAAANELALARLAHPSLAIYNQLAAQEHFAGFAFDLPALVQVVIGAHVHARGADRMASIRVP